MPTHNREHSKTVSHQKLTQSNCCPSLLFAIALLTICQSSLTAQTLGDSNVVAPVVMPGFPEGIAARGGKMYVAGPAALAQPLGSAFVQVNRIKTGKRKAVYPITITNESVGMSAASCIAFGPDGALYVIEPFIGIIRMELNKANDQSIYSAFPPPEGPSLPNDLAFDCAGNLYVTNSFTAEILRIPAGGGPPEVWLSDPAFVGNPEFPFGVNGIRVDKNNQYVYVSVTADFTFNGVIYRIPLVENPTSEDLEEFASLGPTGPDGIAFGKSGKLYVAQALSNTITVLNSEGDVEAVYGGPANDAEAAPVPWANPANIAFDKKRRSLLVTNHASLVPYDPEQFVVFDVYVDDKGARLP